MPLGGCVQKCIKLSTAMMCIIKIRLWENSIYGITNQTIRRDTAYPVNFIRWYTYLQVSVALPSSNVTVESASPPFFGVMGLGYVQMEVMILDAVSY